MKISVVLFLSYVSSARASHVPASTPVPTVSHMPSISHLPSEEPSTSPSTLPSVSPSALPSEEPSASPSALPSDAPSAMPSCVPSEAPTPSPSIRLFYPDQSGSGTCLNDGAEPSWMTSNSATWLFTTQDKCCTQHFSWNYAACIGSLSDTCAKSLWYPDWEGTNTGCVRDGNEPYYMTQNPSNFIFSTKADCCAEHYSYSTTCLGTTSASAGSATKWYADWSSGTETCVNDGNAPDYMVDNESLWLYTNRDDCCARFFSYDLDNCKGTSSSNSGSGKYYPDWEGTNTGCLVDDTTHLAPSYMEGTTYLFDTLNECCDAHYSWNADTCKGTTATVTNKWYADWADSTCYKDCATGGADPDCGGPAESWKAGQLYDTRATCCSTHFSWDYTHCNS